MLITNVQAHHIRIPYDAGVASFKQGASSIAALEIVLVEVSTDAGLTGWGDAFSYVCPRTTVTAIDEMISTGMSIFTRELRRPAEYGAGPFRSGPLPAVMGMLESRSVTKIRPPAVHGPAQAWFAR